MFVINGKSLLKWRPIVHMEESKQQFEGTSFGLSEAGYDIRIKQDIEFFNGPRGRYVVVSDPITGECKTTAGNFCLASSMEEFDTPVTMVGTVKDKSTWARKGLSVFNTVIEPGWKGWLTLELVYHGQGDLIIPAGTGIAQALFSQLVEEADYGEGKYQNAGNFPQPAIWVSDLSEPMGIPSLDPNRD